MKKKLMNAKSLSRSDQSQITGGLHDLTKKNDACIVVDGLTPPGCPCTTSSQCEYAGPVNPAWTAAQYSEKRGTCAFGTCA